MKKFIMIAISSLMFIAPANATTLRNAPEGLDISTEAPIRNSDIMLMCWADYPGTGVNVRTKKETVSIIVSPYNNIATMIDPHNDMVKGNLTVSEYFYTITINQLTSFGKTGVIKINRLSGVLSAVWTNPKTESRPFPQVDARYGACVPANRKQLF
ncbi:hypothetical protein LCGC14_2560810 [marine sediment metagenome]|uniref:Uncharacterized protein n=1 Tax=marine sediment metagenome TaxID=412755 RepID=A0A0F9AK26_9ZZZZ